jgi:hypothetical protein
MLLAYWRGLLEGAKPNLQPDYSRTFQEPCTCQTTTKMGPGEPFCPFCVLLQKPARIFQTVSEKLSEKSHERTKRLTIKRVIAT